LLDAKVNKHSDKQIYITSSNNQRDLLIECPTPEETEEWFNCIKQHIEFAPNSEGRDSMAGISVTNNSSIVGRPTSVVFSKETTSQRKNY
jgi:hypothetical protein